ncbi:MAG: hypothetical protein AAFV33_24725 [Chloroflexota bacterium]
MKLTQTNATPLASAMYGRVVYLLAAVIFVQTIYPMTADGTVLSSIIYNLMGLSFVVSGVLVTRESPNDMRILIGLAIVWGDRPPASYSCGPVRARYPPRGRQRSY